MPPIKLRPKGETITAQQAQELLGKVPIKRCQTTEKFLNDDHWQERYGWVGWFPEATSRTFDKESKLIIQGFTFKNDIKSLINHLKGVVAGQEPDYDTVSTSPITETSGSSEEDKIAGEIDAELVKWWEDKKVHETLKKFVENRGAYGKSLLRFYLPQGLLTPSNDGKTGSLSFTDWKEALKHITLECVHYSQGNSEMDKNFGSDCVVIELPSITSDEKFYEVHYQDESRKTAVRMLSSKEKQDAVPSIKKVDLQGNSLVFVGGEWENAMITEAIHSQQKQVNHAETMESFSLHGINFPEMVFLNADMEQETKVDPTTGQQTSSLKDIIRGIGAWMNVVGFSLQKADGSETLAPADVKWRESADPTKFREVSQSKSRNIHQMAGMLHIFLADNPYVSGESRTVATTDYLIVVTDYETITNKAGHWINQTVYRWANALAGSIPKDVNFIFACELTLGKLSSADKQIMLQELLQQVRSRRSYQIATGITDSPEKEDIAIKNDLKEFPPTPVNPNPTGQGQGASA